jgi:hypothetical protein
MSMLIFFPRSSSREYPYRTHKFWFTSWMILEVVVQCQNSEPSALWSVRVCVRAVCIPFLVDGDDGFHFLCDLIDLTHEDDLIAFPPLVYLQTIPSTSLE